MSTVSKGGVALGLIVAVAAYYVGFASGRASMAEDTYSVVSDAVSQCQRQGDLYLCPPSIAAIAATR